MCQFIISALTLNPVVHTSSPFPSVSSRVYCQLHSDVDVVRTCARNSGGVYSRVCEPASAPTMKTLRIRCGWWYRVWMTFAAERSACMRRIKTASIWSCSWHWPLRVTTDDPPHPVWCTVAYSIDAGGSYNKCSMVYDCDDLRPGIAYRIAMRLDDLWIQYTTSQHERALRLHAAPQNKYIFIMQLHCGLL